MCEQVKRTLSETMSTTQYNTKVQDFVPLQSLLFDQTPCG